MTMIKYKFVETKMDVHPILAASNLKYVSLYKLQMHDFNFNPINKTKTDHVQKRLHFERDDTKEEQ
jgi:hypothetical protein